MLAVTRASVESEGRIERERLKRRSLTLKKSMVSFC
jgi:hypothetical protein